ncbi:MAG TPA: hypothetical protein VGO80_07915 [Solirubrobacteraceae bacterium]|jgi:hypothetical protein|nr:hypothetical protein [Solirubrobacteraceae bacterium]
MRYQRVMWHHDFADEPVLLYSEIDENGRERRKVDEYRDGRLDMCDEFECTGTTRLSLTAMPTLEQIASQSEFTPESISKDEFESVWQRVRSQ